MAYTISSTNPGVWCSPGSFVGYDLRRNKFTIAALFKRNQISTWDGILTMDTGTTTVYHDWMEIDPSNHIAIWNGGTSASDISGAGTTALTSTTEFEIVSLEFNPATPGGAATPILRWQIGANAWASETLASDSAADATAVGAGYRWLIGNDPSLGDDSNIDFVCAGAIKAGLGTAAVQSLTQTDFASWAAVFTGANAWLVGAKDANPLTDETGNGGNETTRANVTTGVADPPGWSWSLGGTVLLPPKPVIVTNQAVMRAAMR